MQKAFVTAEDKRFYQHKGIDERGLIRAFITNLAEPGRPQGGSTITQQVAKNLVVGDDVTYERKMREMIVASRLESLLSKDEILELYLNSIYLGRGAWGIELAARNFFGKPAKDLTVTEGAQLAGLAKGPNFFNPERHPERAKERLAYVLGRMQEDGVITAEQAKRSEAEPLQLVTAEAPARRDSGFYFVDQIPREVRSLGLEHLGPETYTVHSTIRPDLQRAAETALQDGLAKYEASTGRARFQGPETSLAEAVKKIEAAHQPGKPSWQQALEEARLPLYDLHWMPAIVVPGRKGAGVQVGLTDGRVLPLSIPTAAIRKALAPYDVVYVRVGHDPQCARRAANPAGRAGRGRGSRQCDRRGAGRGRRVFLSAEPAQSRHTGTAPARVHVQAVHLPRSSAQRPAAQHDHQGCGDLTPADQRRQRAEHAEHHHRSRSCRTGITGRHAITAAVPGASRPCAVAWRIPAIW